MESRNYHCHIIAILAVAVVTILFALPCNCPAQTIINPDADGFSHDTDISIAFAGVTLSSIGSDGDGHVYAYYTPSYASTGTNTFGGGSSNNATWYSDLRLQADFDYLSDRVTIDIIGNDSSDYGVLEAYNSSGILLASVTSPKLGDKQVFAAEIIWSSYDIAYIIASGLSGDTVYLDNLTIQVFMDTLSIEPAAGLVSSGNVGGPFVPQCQTYTLTNTSPNSLDWTASAIEPWLDVTTASGTLGPSDINTVEVSINANANSLPMGVYTDTVTFTNITSGVAQTRGVTLQVGMKKVLAYIEYTDISQEYPNTLAAIDSVSTNYTLTELTDYTQLDSMLPGHDVLLIPEQESASSSQLVSIGTTWSTTVQSFVNNGGVVIQCDHNGRYGILTGAGLMSIASSANFTGESVVVAPDDPVAQGVSSPYTASEGSSYYNTTEQTVVVERTGSGPVVINKQMGLGNVMLIGHDYYNSNADQDRIVGNAVFNLPFIPDDLKVEPLEGFTSSGEVGGPFDPPSKTYTLTDINGTDPLDWAASATQPWLDVDPNSGMLNPGDSNTVVVSINANANTLPQGIYTDTVTFSNLTSGVNRTRGVNLLVGRTASVPFVEGFEGGPTLNPWWEVTGTNEYRTEVTTSNGPHTGSYHVTMDSVSGGARNELTLTVNLENYEDVILTFWAKEFDDEYDGPPPVPFTGGYDFDGIAVSEDGILWYEVLPLDTLSSTYAQLSVDLDAAIATHGLTYNSTFKIRFNQYDDNPISTDGIAIDDIEITGTLKDDLIVTPFEGFYSVGDRGGKPEPFEPNSKEYTLTNVGPNSLDWLVEPNLIWLDTDPNSGTLPPDSNTTVTISINAHANDLDPNIYTGTITFGNLTSGFVQTRDAVLEIVKVPGEIEVTDSIPPVDDNEMPFSKVIVGLSRTEQVTITNIDPEHELIVDIQQFEGFYDEFPSTTLDPAKWTNTSGIPTIDDVGIGEPSPPYSLRLNGYPGGGDAVESRVINLSGLSGAELTYWWERTGGGESPDSGEDLIISYWTGSNWVELERQLGDGPDMTSYVQSTITLPPEALHAGFRLQISSIGSSGRGELDDWFVDNVSITMTDAGGVTATEDLFSWSESKTLEGVEPTGELKLTEGFQLENLPNLPATIAPMSSITFDVNFLPTEVKEYESVLVITSDDRDAPNVPLLLTGTGILDYLEIIPDANLEFSGHPGGPFVPTYDSYRLTNIGPVNIDWTVEPNVPWLDVDPNSGTLQPGDLNSITVTVTPNSQANTLPQGYHCGELLFRNFTTGMSHTRLACLNIYTEPKIWISPYSFDVTVPQGGTETRILTIGNTGGSDLDFTLSSRLINFTPPPEQGVGGGLAMELNDIVASIPPGHDFTVLAEDAAFAPGQLLVRLAPEDSEGILDTDRKISILSSLGDAVVEREYEIVPGLSLVKLPAGVTVEQALVSFNQTDGILYAQPDYELTVDSDQQYFPNDSRFDELWGLHNTGQSGGTPDADIDAPEAWDIATNASEIIVAVIDTGVDYTHPDLAANMWVNEAEFNGTPGVDDDGNGYIDDIYGYDFRNNDGDPMDDHYHGTHCAGTVGAVGNNSEGVAGVCWNVRIMALKWMSSSGNGYTSDAIACVEYSTLMGANLSSNSWRQVNTSIPNPALEDAINRAGAAGLLFVASAGNDDVNNDVYPHYPSSYDSDNVIAVMATDEYDNKSSFSCYGLTSVDLGAPGSSILSCQPGGGYQYLNGTSMATPHVAGACALIWSACPSLTHLEVKDIILETVDPLVALDGFCVTGGRLNLHQAIIEAEALCEAPDGGPWLELVPDAGSVAPGDTMDVNVIFDGNRPAAGTYEGFITISSSDPYEGNMTIPVTMTVEPTDYFTELFDPNYLDPNDPNYNDMANRTLTFRPDESYSYYKACISEANDFPVDSNGGTIVSLGDDDYIQVNLDGASINFYGHSYETFYIGSNGYISFISGDIRHFETLVDHFDLPRISGLFDDLDPSAGGTISWKQLDDRVVVTFESVPEYSLANSNSFQIEMFFNGTLRITWLDIAAQDGLVGLSDGYELPPCFIESDLSEYSPSLCDLDDDCDVDFTDFSILAAYWQNQHDDTETVRDEFNSVSYSGNDGTQSWSNSWQEAGEADGPSSGLLQVLSDGTMRIGDKNAKELLDRSLTREADLSGATTATLTYDYAVEDMSGGGYVSVQVSSDSGSNWDTLMIYLYDAAGGSESFDITSYISSDTQIRFAIGSESKIKMYLYFDNIQIEFDNPDRPWYPWCNGSDFSHDFRVDSKDLQIFVDHWLE